MLSILLCAAIVENSVGFTMTIGIERSGAHRLQTLPLVRPQDAGLGKKYVSFLLPF